MSRYQEYLIDRPINTPVSYNPQNIPGTDWNQVANQVAQTLGQVKNPVNPWVEAPSAFVLSGGHPQYAVKINATTVSLESTEIVSNPTTSIKIPDKDNVIALNNNNIDEATITALVFEKLGAVELTKFTRNDTVEGINPYYNIISNLSAIKKEFDPSDIISSQKSDTSLLNAFSIKLNTKIPGDRYLADRGLDSYIYIDVDGNLIIELDNITSDELIEIEIDTNGTIVEVRD
jgi:hypothetical protein